MNQQLKSEIESKLYELSEESFSVDIRKKLKDLAEFISGALGNDESEFLYKVIDNNNSWEAKRDTVVARINGRLYSSDWAVVKSSKTTVSELAAQVEQLQNNKVFIVHGHDDAARESVARFLEKLGLIPIILHEQANSSLTVIEKLERNSDVGFAVVLLTPDDVGNKRELQADLISRARQNVLIELGYFVGKLGRGRVCPLRVGDTEIPSDFSGVVYTDMDKAGAWRTKLAQELNVAKFTINLEALVS